MINRIKNRLKQELYYLKKYLSAKEISKGHRVKYFNYWDVNPTDNWLFNFLKSKGFLTKYPDLTISFFSVYGPKYLINLARSDIKILYNAENVYRNRCRYARYQDMALDRVDLAIGFRELSAPNYLRFPQWVKHMFDADSSEDDIRKRCGELSNLKIPNRNRFAAHVSRHDDPLRIRSGIINALSKIDRVDGAGSFMNNTDELKKQYDDDKIEFLKNYTFNICPENTNSQYYVTEKLVHAIRAGCIPIYWGANGNPEPEILNRDAIIFWDGDGSTIQKIKELHYSDKKFKEFAEQPRLKPGAIDVVIEMFRNFEKNLSELFERKKDNHFIRSMDDSSTM